ncbi:serine hydrolase domain-containing protein [Nocardia sp. NPDC050175]|uniref:serine hydrolase domain-containing protein n=1 Tax=Nocardia sp. NPDC050175 TaxID=3364317 RepID=UPI003787F0B7
MLGSSGLGRFARGCAVGLVFVSLATTIAGCGSRVDAPALSAPVTSEIDELVRRQMEAGLIPGVLVAVRDPEQGSFTKAYGRADVRAERAMTVDDHVRIGSVTKSFTATAVLRAADEGKLSLDDPLSRYVPTVPNAENITVRDLLGMRGGVWGVDDDNDFASQLYSKTPAEWHDGDRVRSLIAHPERARPPRTRTEYSNSEYFLLGLVLEKVTGRPVPDVLTGVATAHGLHETTYPADATMPSPAARGYTYFDETPTDVTARTGPAIFGAAGSMVSTISDLAQYASLLARGDLLKPETLRTRTQFTSGTFGRDPIDYGLGLMRWGTWLGHSGSVLGYTTQVAYLPERGASIAVAVNQHTMPPALLRFNAFSLWLAIARYLYPDSLGGNVTSTVPSPPLPIPENLTTQLQQAFDPAIPLVQKSLRVMDDDKDPELITRLASTLATHPMTFQVDRVTQLADDTLFATTTATFAGGKRPMVIPFSARDNTWRLATSWVCESLLLGGESSPACS